jgi:uncharacterized protein
MRKWGMFFGALFLLFLGTFQVAEAATTAVDDGADLFTSDQVEELNQKMESLSEKSKAAIFIVTTISYGNEDNSRDFSDQYILDHVGKNQNAILFLINSYDREVYISTSGNMIDYMTDKRIDDTLDAVTEEAKYSNYFNAAEIFLDKTNEYFEAGVPGGHYRVDEATGKIIRYKVITPLELSIAVIGALVISLAFFFISISRYRLRSGTYKYPFRDKSILNLTTQTDQLIKSFVTTRRIQRNNNSGGGFGSGGGGGSTTHSSGGGSFGGGGRSF